MRRCWQRYPLAVRRRVRGAARADRNRAVFLRTCASLTRGSSRRSDELVRWWCLRRTRTCEPCFAPWGTQCACLASRCHHAQRCAARLATDALPQAVDRRERLRLIVARREVEGEESVMVERIAQRQAVDAAASAPGEQGAQAGVEEKQKEKFYTPASAELRAARGWIAAYSFRRCVGWCGAPGVAAPDLRHCSAEERLSKQRELTTNLDLFNKGEAEAAELHEHVQVCTAPPPRPRVRAHAHERERTPRAAARAEYSQPGGRRPAAVVLPLRSGWRPSGHQQLGRRGEGVALQHL